MNKTQDLVYWMLERERIRELKNNGVPPPWTEDPHMANVRYCNVRREDDKVTKWIAKHWRNPNVNDPNLTLAMVMARMINWPPTLDELGYPKRGGEDLKFWRDAMKYISGKKWTGAYTISTCGRSMGKEDYVFDHVLRQVADWQTAVTHGTTLADYHAELMGVDGLGSFLAAQVVADLKNTPGHPLTYAPDWWEWSAHGPGSLRGLAAYYGAPATPSSYPSLVTKAYQEVAPFTEPVIGRIHMQDFQNCLCEFSKYMRVKEGDGRVRNKYSAG